MKTLPWNSAGMIFVVDQSGLNEKERVVGSDIYEAFFLKGRLWYQEPI